MLLVRITLLLVVFYARSTAQTVIQTTLSITGLSTYYCSEEPVLATLQNTQSHIRYIPRVFSQATGLTTELPSFIGNGAAQTIPVPFSALGEGNNTLSIRAEFQLDREQIGGLPRIFTALFTPTKPVIDGLLQEPNWNLAGKLRKSAQGTASDDVTFSVLWDMDGLYVGVRVFDNEVNTASTELDIVRLFFDPTENQTKGDYFNTFTQTCGSTGIHGVYFFRNVFGNSNGPLITSIPGCLPPGISVSNSAKGIQRLSVGGYIAEFSFPWSMLGVNIATRLGALTSSGIGFDMMKDEVTGGILQARSAWNGSNANFFNNSNFGRLVISPSTSIGTNLTQQPTIVSVRVSPPPASDSNLVRVNCGTTIITRGNLPEGREGVLERLFWQFERNSIDTSLLSQTFGSERNYVVPSNQFGFGRVYLRTQDIRYRRCWSAQSSVFKYEVRQSPRAPSGIDGLDGVCGQGQIFPRDSMRIIDAQGLVYFWQTSATDSSKLMPVNPQNPALTVSVTSQWFLRARYKDVGGASCWSQAQQSPSKRVVVELPPTTIPSAGLSLIEEGCGVATITSSLSSIPGIRFYAVLGSNGEETEFPMSEKTLVNKTGTYYVRPRTVLAGCFGPAFPVGLFVNVGNPDIAAPVPLTPELTIEQFSSPPELEVQLLDGAVARWYVSETGGVGFQGRFKPDSSTLGTKTYYVSQVLGKCESPRASIVVNTILPEVPETPHVGFSPNGDGINDELRFKFLEKYPNPKLTIVDKWGNVVFEQQPYNNAFTGISDSGKKLPAGVYSYILQLDSGQKPRIGTLSIIY